MYWSRRLKRWARALVGPACGLALTGYFAHNLVIGDRGLLAWRRLTEQLHAENARLAALQAEREAMTRKVSDLTPDHLDPDLLDERVRATLNLVAPNELVIMRDTPAALH
ncbi:MAG TPA: septum formation initiator family protein [Stellaceae bacterium]|jgi:cell division protein FtsB|nr:septum formation initiator family protein [Stellaceae bacterium]